MTTIIRTLLIGFLLPIAISGTLLAQLGEPQSSADEISALQARLVDLPFEQTGSIEVAEIELSLGTRYQTIGDHQAANESTDDEPTEHLQASLKYLNQALESGEEHVLSDPEITLATLASTLQLERFIDRLMDSVGYRGVSSGEIPLGRTNAGLVEELCQRSLPRVLATSVLDSNSEMIFSSPGGASEGDAPLLDSEQLRPYFNRCNNAFSDAREQRSALLEAQLEFAAPNDWLRLGDWFLMTGEIAKAQEWYAKVWEAALSQSPDLLSRVTQPEPLTLASLIPQAPDLRRGYRDTRTLRLQLDIDDDGQLRRVELQQGSTNLLSESEYSAVTGWIKSLPFRLPLDSGALEDRSGVLCHFSLARKLCLPD